MANFYDLKHYIAHYLNKGRCLVSNKSKIIPFSDRVYDRRGNYSEPFNCFIDRLLESGEFFHLYIEGDKYAFGELVHSKYDLEYCVRCEEPIPTASALGPPAHYLYPDAASVTTVEELTNENGYQRYPTERKQ
ncbi:MAG: hypothetical protein H7Y22_00030 [Gemmatimonadaceae bacterium]|nr:hypothetical protein [Gloeobacterales cyanobacterium ES-bin-141]